MFPVFSGMDVPGHMTFLHWPTGNHAAATKSSERARVSPRKLRGQAEGSLNERRR